MLPYIFILISGFLYFNFIDFVVGKVNHRAFTNHVADKFPRISVLPKELTGEKHPFRKIGFVIFVVFVKVLLVNQDVQITAFGGSFDEFFHLFHIPVQRSVVKHNIGAAEEYINRINANPQWGYVIRGILDNHVPRGTMYRGVKVIGTIDNLMGILPVSELDEIAVTLALSDYDHLEEIVALCEKSGVHTKFIPDYNSLIPNKPYTEDLMGLPLINIRYVPLSNTVNAVAKRVVDIVGSLCGIILLSPLLLVVAVIVKTTSKGPVIFKQERVGLHNKSFKMYKFRTMRMQEPGEEKKGWTVKDDPRVTKVGKFLRKTSIDELPQMFNILRGDMSIVGPRPERPQFVEKFKEEIPRYMIKHQVRPGLTGWAQVNGYRGDTSIRRRIDFDLYYIENWTMGFDFKIMFMTIFKGFINENAY